MKKLNYLLILSLVLFSHSYGKNLKDRLPDMGIEIGFGQNTLDWVKSNNILTVGDGEYKRKDMYITPTIRISYRSSLYRNIYAQLFMGYTEFGGKSSADQYNFKCHEYGMLAYYSYSNFSFGAGLKVNQILKVKYHMNYLDENRSDWFTKYSGNFGLKASYLIRNVSISTEAWFGITNLSALGGVSYENQYRILLGYYFIS